MLLDAGLGWRVVVKFTSEEEERRCGVYVYALLSAGHSLLTARHFSLDW